MPSTPRTSDITTATKDMMAKARKTLCILKFSERSIPATLY